MSNGEHATGSTQTTLTFDEVGVVIRCYLQKIIADLDEQLQRYNNYDPSEDSMKKWKKGMVKYLTNARGILQQHSETTLKHGKGLPTIIGIINAIHNGDASNVPQSVGICNPSDPKRCR